MLGGAKFLLTINSSVKIFTGIFNNVIFPNEPTQVKVLRDPDSNFFGITHRETD